MRAPRILSIPDIIPEENWKKFSTPEEAEPKGDAAPYFAVASGRRVIKGELQYCGTVADYEKMSNHIATNILPDEHTRPVKFVENPPHLGQRRNDLPNKQHTRENNTFWLQAIADGYWPIMAQNPIDCERYPNYWDHDYDSDHPIFMVSAPCEIQDEITKAAHHGLERRRQQEEDPTISDALLLPGENEHSTLPVGLRIPAKDATAIRFIDSISDSYAYRTIMGALLVASTPKRQERYMAGRPQKWHAEHAYPDYIYRHRRNLENDMATIVNYNIRHEQGRNATVPELREAAASYITGMLRVAALCTARK